MTADVCQCGHGPTVHVGYTGGCGLCDACVGYRAFTPAPLSSPRRTRDEGRCDHDCAVIVSDEDYQRSEGVCAGCGVRMKNDTETGWGPLLPFGDVPCGSRVGECCPPHKFTNEGAPDVCDTCGDSEHPPVSDEGTEDEAEAAWQAWRDEAEDDTHTVELTSEAFIAGFRAARLAGEERPMSDEPKRYVRGVDDMPAGTYQENDDGTYSPAQPYEPPPLRFHLRQFLPRRFR